MGATLKRRDSAGLDSAGLKLCLSSILLNVFLTCFGAFSGSFTGLVVRGTVQKLTRTTFDMATIRARKLADGTVSYTAQIPIKRDGVQVYQESQIFARKQAAQAWIKRQETELAQSSTTETAT